MALKLAALIAKTEAAIAGETDAKKKTRLAAQLATYEATKRAMGGDSDEPPGDDDDKDDEDGDDDAAAKHRAKAAKEAKKAEASKHKAKAAEHKAKAAEYEEMAKKCMADDEGDEDSAEEAAARVAEQRAETDAAAAARASSDALTDRVSRMERERDEETKGRLIAEASGKRISPAQSKLLAKEPLAYVRKYIEMAPKALVSTIEDVLQPDANGKVPLPEATMKEIDERVETMVSMLGDLSPAARKLASDKMRADLVEARRTATTTNGIAGRL